MGDKIEILSVDLLEEQPDLVREFRDIASRYGLELGWHYALDLAWIASHLGDPRGMQIMDAGAGTGVMQWWLAGKGAEVVSVDRIDRRDLSCRFRLAYNVRSLSPRDLHPVWRLIPYRLADLSNPLGYRLRGALRAVVTNFIIPFSPKAAGHITFYRQDLARLTAIPDDNFDAIVSVSALEHNRPDELEQMVNEITRVLKPGGVILATLVAARGEDWLHEPSGGWCYSDQNLRRVFKLSQDAQSNYEEYDILFSKLYACDDLRENLPSEVFESGDNGMPWGIWDPKYQPVGVLKVKSDDGASTIGVGAA